MSDERSQSRRDTRVPLNLLAADAHTLSELVQRFRWPKYRTTQILRWIYQRRIQSIEQMTDLSLIERRALQAVATIQPLVTKHVRHSTDSTRKLIFALEDGLSIEAVLIPDADRLTICLSTQVGCTLDCGFCLTGTMGLKRNLRPHEIVGQLLNAFEHLGPKEQITNVVFMGMGEPLANLEALAEAIRCMTDQTWGLGWSPRRITVSTAGLAARLKDVAILGVNLAVSLNATTDELRRQLMPAAHRLASLKTLMAACRRYPLPSNRRLTFEYVLLAKVNDRDEDARRLTKLLRGVTCKVNLIPFNEFPGNDYRRPSDRDVLAFQAILRQAHIDTFIRKSRGRDVLGACGQLGELQPSSPPLVLTQIEPHC